MRQLQAEHRIWIDKKYPNQPSEIPAAGCVEEAGELLHAVLKLQQVGIWGEEQRYTVPKLREALIDAIGDCGIYVCSLCNANGWDFEEFWGVTTYQQSLPTLTQAVYLVERAAAVAVAPKNRICLTEYIVRLKAIAFTVGIDADVAVRMTWLEVKER